MILSNVEIIKCLKKKYFSIEPLAQSTDPSQPPFNTTAIDLRLGNEIIIPTSGPVAIDLRPGTSIAKYLSLNSEKITIATNHPYDLRKDQFILASTFEKVNFPINTGKGKQCYSARVEGKSSIARCGVIVHLTAPTIHTNFIGPITLELTNLSDTPFVLRPEMYICQLIIEEVKGCPKIAPNQFSGQIDSTGIVKAK